MRPLDQGRVGAPAGSLEGGRVEEALVEGKEALTNAISDFVEIAGAQLVRDQTGEGRLVQLPSGPAGDDLLFYLDHRHGGLQ